MLKLLPLVIAVLYALAFYQFSAWSLARRLDRTATPLRDPALDGVRGKLARALGVPAVPVHIHEVPVVNGLAAPDGRVFLTRGFYDKFRSGEVTEAELATVIAHELGHVALGHSRRRMIDFSGQNAIRLVLASLIGRLLPGIGMLIAGLLTSLLAARLSRQDEYEADEWASALLIKAGIGTAPQKSLFRKLEALTGAPGGATPAWLLTHPKTEERIAAIERNEQRWGTLR